VSLAENYANNAITTLNGAITSGATSLIVTSATGFPAVPFRITVAALARTTVTNTEIMLVTNVVGTTFTVTRAQEGTTAVAHSSGESVAQVLTAAGAVATFVTTSTNPTTTGNITIDCAGTLSIGGTNATSIILGGNSLTVNVAAAVNINSFAQINGAGLLVDSTAGNFLSLGGTGTGILLNASADNSNTVIAVGTNGLGLQSYTQPLASTNVVLTANQYCYPCIVLNGSLTANVKVTFPNAQGCWFVDFSALTFAGRTTFLASGTASLGITAVSASANLVLLRCSGSNAIAVNQ
jgi:hypothetical protein